MPEPVGELSLVETRVRPSKHAVYATLVLEDAEGRRWEAEASWFRYDLRLIDEGRRPCPRCADGTEQERLQCGDGAWRWICRGCLARIGARGGRESWRGRETLRGGKKNADAEG